MIDITASGRPMGSGGTAGRSRPRARMCSRGTDQAAVQRWKFFELGRPIIAAGHLERGEHAAVERDITVEVAFDRQRHRRAE